MKVVVGVSVGVSVFLLLLGVLLLLLPLAELQRGVLPRVDPHLHRKNRVEASNPKTQPASGPLVLV